MTDSPNTQPPPPSDRIPVIDVQTLLGPEGRAFLLHDETVYTLRLTRNDKLILTK
ncbi:MAG: hemin uptake protein HemP [Rhodobacteraceae bacterium]|jgi:hemin uptake protein HemP|nr:hemin uptake protein HemP [Paracoccaceae bacterium]